MAGEQTAGPAGSKAKVFNCTNCGAPLRVQALGQTLVVACASCASVIDAQDERHQVLSKGARLQAMPLIPIGTRGQFRGHLWEVIGYMVRYDKASDYDWREYLLFNPRQGFRWLTEADGHWSYVVPVHTKGQVLGDTATSLNQSYKLFHKGTAIVSQVIGEFYWRVKTGDAVQVQDFIRPPEVLSVEKTTDEQTWSLSTYVEPSEIATAFKVTQTMPWRKGVAPNQPGYTPEAHMRLWGYAGLFFFALLIIHLMTSPIRGTKAVYQYTNFLMPGEAIVPIVSEPFTLVGSPRVLSVRMEADVDNSWLAAELTLFDTKTGKGFEFEHGVEYYRGYEGGEHWSEGSQVREFSISSVPAGTYTLTMLPKTDTLTKPISYTITVKSGGVIWSNFFLGLLLLAVPPLVAMWRRHRQEKKRWSQSDFAPAVYQEDE